MKNLNLLILSFLALASANFAFGQTTIRGTVTDQDGNPLIAANVLVRGTVDGTLTKHTGAFTLKTSESPPFTIIVSWDKFSKSIEVKTVLDQLDIVLGTEEKDRKPTLTPRLPVPSPPEANKMEREVVRLIVQKEFGEDIGTGLILGQEQGQLYILTANHVIEGGEKTEALLFEQDEAKPAKIISQNPALDAAVVSIPLKQQWTLSSLVPFDEKNIQPKQKISSIGHPSGALWRTNYLNVIQQTALPGEPAFFAITPQAIVGGCSGGPVFTEKGAWVGIVTETSMVEARCLKAEVVLRWLEQKSVPVQRFQMGIPPTANVKGRNAFDIDLNNNFFTVDDEGQMVIFDRGVIEDPYMDELKIPSFQIGKYEITVKQFMEFVYQTNYHTEAEQKGWSYCLAQQDGELVLEAKSGANWACDAYGQQRHRKDYDHPVIHISLNDALAYCSWLSKKFNKKVRLPSAYEIGIAELECEMCSQHNGNLYDADLHKYNPENHHSVIDIEYKDSDLTTSSAGSYKACNKSQIFDLCSNVSEWTQSSYEGKDYKLITGLNWLQWTLDLKLLRGDVYKPIPYRWANPFVNIPISVIDQTGNKIVREVKVIEDNLLGENLPKNETNCYTGFRIVIENE